MVKKSKKKIKKNSFLFQHLSKISIFFQIFQIVKIIFPPCFSPLLYWRSFDPLRKRRYFFWNFQRFKMQRFFFDLLFSFLWDRNELRRRIFMILSVFCQLEALILCAFFCYQTIKYLNLCVGITILYS